VESSRPLVRLSPLQSPDPAPLTTCNSYNRYIAVASRVVRRSLKEDKRIIAERRGVSELRFAKWEVSDKQGSSRQSSRLTKGRTASRARSRS
jgi:F-type H+-transporting ATPase subunit epsilon